MDGADVLFGSDACDSDSDAEHATRAAHGVRAAPRTKRQRRTWQRREVAPQPPLPLKDFQASAIEQMVKRLVEGVDGETVEGQLLMLGTGGGKTAIAANTMRDCHGRWQRASQGGAGVNRWGENTSVWVVAPSAGGNLLIQWQTQLVRAGVDNHNILMQSELQREDQRRRFLGATGIKVFVSSFQTAHLIMQDTKRESSAFVRNLPWRMLVIDEVHFYRNGVPSQGDAVYDPDAKMFNSMRALSSKVRGVGGKVLTLTATPLVNNRVNVYALLVLMCNAHGYDKERWLPDVSKRDFASQRRRMLRLHATLAEMPDEIANRGKTNEIKVMIQLSEAELLVTYDTNLEVAAAIDHYKVVMAQYGPQRFVNAEARRQCDEAQRMLMNAITKARRCAANIGFSGQTRYEHRPVHNKKTGRDKVVRTPVPTPMDELMGVSDADLSKYREIRKIVQKHAGQGERVLVATEWARVVDFVVAKLRQDVPGVPVHSHHSKNNTVEAMQSFLDEGGVLVGTRGTFGTGLSVEVTTAHDEEPRVRPAVIVNVDYAFSHAAMAQMNGRTRRPLAQPDVRSWTVYQLVSTAAPVMTVDEALEKIVSGKQRMGAELFDGQNDGERGDVGRAADSPGFEGTLTTLSQLRLNVPDHAVRKSSAARTARIETSKAKKQARARQRARQRARRAEKRERGEEIHESDGLTSSEEEEEAGEASSSVGKRPRV